MMKRRLRRKEGDVFGIKLSNNLFAFCQVMSPKACVCFFDYYSSNLKVDQLRLENAKVIYKLFVNDSAFRDEDWNFINNAEIIESAKAVPWFFRKEIGTEKYIKFTYGNSKGFYVSREQAINEGLLSGASYMANHIKDLLYAHHECKKSIWHKNLYP